MKPKTTAQRVAKHDFDQKMRAEEKGLVRATVRFWTKIEDRENCIKAMRKAGIKYEVKP